MQTSFGFVYYKYLSISSCCLCFAIVFIHSYFFDIAIVNETLLCFRSLLGHVILFLSSSLQIWVKTLKLVINACTHLSDSSHLIRIFLGLNFRAVLALTKIESFQVINYSVHYSNLLLLWKFPFNMSCLCKVWRTYMYIATETDIYVICIVLTNWISLVRKVYVTFLMW